MNSLVLVLFFTLSNILSIQADTAYWVWERTKPLTSEELTKLKTAHVSRLYWQAGTLTNQGSLWTWQERFTLNWSAIKAPELGPKIIPVLRLNPKDGLGLPESSFPELLSKVSLLLYQAQSKEVQIDYECPDRLIPNYLKFLVRLKASHQDGKLSISALAHWSRYQSKFKGLVDEITPMFYDLNPHQEVMDHGKLATLFDTTQAQTQIMAWKECSIPWRAGLPNFSRISVFGLNGKNRGNFRTWLWDELWFTSFLFPTQATSEGQTFFNVTKDSVLKSTFLMKDEAVVIRYPDRSALQNILPVINSVGAEGPLYFRLAGADDMSGYSIRDLAQTNISPPHFTLNLDSASRLILTNDSACDLMPQVFGRAPDQRSYTLQIQSGPNGWRDVLPGEFANATVSDNTLNLSFTHLAAEQSLRTGLIELGPEDKSARITWQIKNLEKENTWHILDTTSH